MSEDVLDRPSSEPSLAATITALGIAQIISWGSLFYTIAVLGSAMREASGVGEMALFASYSAGLVLSGVFAPWIGRQIDARGGRPMLAAGSVAGALACGALALVEGPWSLILAWLIAGIAMALTLYDPAFATLNQVAGAAYRRSVTVLTLFGGFASTVFWPLSQFLLDTVGMRATYAIYALLHLFVCLPLHWYFVPRFRGHASVPETRVANVVPAAGRVFVWLVLALTLASFVASALSAHLIAMLASAGLDARDAVLIGALIGPMQVVGRIMEFALGARMGPITAGTLSFATLAASLVLFALASHGLAIAIAFAVLYGWSNGVLTIVRGTVPAELFGRERYGALLGRLAMPQFLARALAPAALAALVVADPGRMSALVALVIGGVIALVAYLRAIDSRNARAK